MSEASKIQEQLHIFETYSDYWQDKYEIIRENRRFYRANGGQWDSDDQAYLNEKSRPVLEYNLIGPNVQTVVGTYINRRLDMMAVPVGPEDLPKQEVFNRLLYFIKNKDRVNRLNMMAAKNAIIDGIAWGRVGVRFDRNPMGEPYMSYDDALHIMHDPNSREDDISDARDIFRHMYVDPYRLIHRFPNKKREIQKKIISKMSQREVRSGTSKSDTAITDDDMRSDLIRFSDDGNTVQAIEHWYWDYTDKRVVVNKETKNVYNVRNFEEGSEDEEMFGAFLAGRPELRSFRQRIRNLHVCAFAGDILLEDKKYPFETNTLLHIPFFFNKLNRDFHGHVDWMKDPQREFNKRSSTQLLGLIKEANSDWLIEEGAIDEMQWAEDTGIKYVKPGMMGAVQQLRPAAQSTGYSQYTQNMNNILYQIGLSAVTQGQTDQNRQSGRLFEGRVQQSQMRLGEFFQNDVEWRQGMAKEVIKLAQQVMTEPEWLRVLGEDGAKEYFSINMSEWDDITTGEYDFIIDEAQQRQTARQQSAFAMFQVLQTMAASGIPANALPWDELVDSLDVTHRDSIKQRIQQALGQPLVQGQGSAGGTPAGLPGGLAGPVAA